MILLERASQLQVLDAVLAKAKTQQGCVALVYGEAGIGKTSLVEQFVNQNKKSWRILQGACDSLFTPRPLGPLHDIVLQTEGSLRALLEAESNRTAIFSAFLNELKEQETILVIEDAHWADEATLDLLKYLGRRIKHTTSLMILTYRNDEIGTDHPLRFVLGDLVSSHALHHVPVPSLSKDAVHELAKDKKVDVAQLHHLTNGNPFYVTEVLAVESGIPETVRDAVLMRAARLSPSARVVLEAAAVIGSRAEAWLLSNVVGKEYARVEECIAKGMLQSNDEYYTFRHELARHTILESISSQRKIALHRLTLLTLKESSETRNDFARLVDHALGAKDAEAVLEYAPAAAREANALGAHRQASSHYRAALNYADRLPAAARAELLDAYADVCDATIENIEAQQAQMTSLTLWKELGRLDKQGRALRRLSDIAFDENSDAYLAEAIKILEKLPPTRELAMAYSHKSRVHLWLNQVEESIRWGYQALELGERLGDSETIASALNNIGCQEMSRGLRAEGQAKMERGLQVALAADLQIEVARAYQNLGVTLASLYDYSAALHCLDDGIAYCTRHDIDWWHFALLGARADVEIQHGLWNEAQRDIQMANELWGMLKPISPLGLISVRVANIRLHVRRGDSVSMESLEETRQFIKSVVLVELSDYMAATLAEAAWLRGELALCRDEAQPTFLDACQRNAPRTMGQLAFWLWRAGALTDSPVDVPEPYSTQIRGNWREAASMWEKFGCPYEQGMALMDGDEAAQFAALEIFERLGAKPIIEILKTQMRAQGIRIPRGARPTTRENPYALTAREMEVLSCLTSGLSNHAIAKQLSLSTRTVEHHISSILQKMGVRSRNEAVARSSNEKLFPSQ